MIIDSNVIIHFLRNDVPAQRALTNDFFKKIDEGKEKGEISILVINEVIWALGTQYKIERSDFISKLIRILVTKNIEIIEAKKEMIGEILKKMIGNKIDFTDYYLIAISVDKGIFSFEACNVSTFYSYFGAWFYHFDLSIP